GSFVDHAVDLPSMERGVAGTSGVSLPHVAWELFGTGPVTTVMALALAGACGAAALVAWARRRHREAPLQMRGVGALAAASVLFPPHVIFYDAGLLVLTGAGLAAADGRWDRSGWLVLYLASFTGAVAGTVGVNPLLFVALGGLLAALRTPAEGRQALVSASRT
ncbi:MAG TPA: hypothetical protein VHE80_06605, partial [Acidimicrobiales bacterium]|nr:hypothetical protein [Acidimicrobiales bacterium]